MDDAVATMQNVVRSSRLGSCNSEVADAGLLKRYCGDLYVECIENHCCCDCTCQLPSSQSVIPPVTCVQIPGMLQEELGDGEEIAHCPSCSLTILSLIHI